MATINPYRPSGMVDPDKTDIRECVRDLLSQGSEVRFAGTLDDDDLEEFLSLTPGSNVAPLLLIPIVFGCLAVLMNASWPWIMSAVGLALLFLVMVSLLSRSYRRSDFLAFNASWDRPVEGRVFASGYEYRSQSVDAAITWEGIANTFVNEQMVAFQSAVQANIYRVIPRRFVSNDLEWTMLQSVGEAIHCDEKEMATASDRVSRAKKRLNEPGVSVVRDSPVDAIRYAGSVRGSDVRRQRVPDRQRSVYYRYVFYAVIALVGVSAIIGGIAGLIFRGVAMPVNPSMTLLSTAMVVFTVFGVWVWLGSRRRARQDYTLFYQSGFLTEQTLRFDVGVYALTIDWNGLQLTSEESERVCLWELCSECAISLTREMFDSDASWQNALEVIRRRSAGEIDE